MEIDKDVTIINLKKTNLRLKIVMAILIFICFLSFIYAFVQKGIAEENLIEAVHQHQLADQAAVEAMRQKDLAQKAAEEAVRQQR